MEPLATLDELGGVLSREAASAGTARRLRRDHAGEDVKTVQELLRHANSRITFDVYTQAVNSNKRAAQSKVVKMMVPNLGEIKDEKHSQNGR